MLKPLRTPARRGFTLVEVALAVAVGLIILSGAVMGYNAIKDQASSAGAREKLQIAQAAVQAYASANFGRFPTSVADDASGLTSGAFTGMWQRHRPDDYNTSPWGGPTGDADGVTEIAPFTNGAAQASAPDVTSTLTTNAARAGNVIYASIQGPGFVAVQQKYNPTATTVNGYVLSIYDRTGAPWFHLHGNNM